MKRVNKKNHTLIFRSVLSPPSATDERSTFAVQPTEAGLPASKRWHKRS